MSKKNILRIILIIVVVCFLLPYNSITYSNPFAGGKVDTSILDSLSKDLGEGDLWHVRDFGGIVEDVKKSYPRFMNIPSFVVVIVGLVITFIRSKKAVLFSAIAAVVGFVCTIVLTFTIRSWMITNNSAEVIIKVNYQAGFYLILAGFAAAAAFGFYASYNKKPVQMPYMGQQYVPPQQENVNRFCSECGFKIGSGDELCSNCGTKVQ